MKRRQPFKTMGESQSYWRRLASRHAISEAELAAMRWLEKVFLLCPNSMLSEVSTFTIWTMLGERAMRRDDMRNLLATEKRRIAGARRKKTIKKNVAKGRKRTKRD